MKQTAHIEGAGIRIQYNGEDDEYDFPDPISPARARELARTIRGLTAWEAYGATSLELSGHDGGVDAFADRLEALAAGLDPCLDCLRERCRCALDEAGDLEAQLDYALGVAVKDLVDGSAARAALGDEPPAVEPPPEPAAEGEEALPEITATTFLSLLIFAESDRVSDAGFRDLALTVLRAWEGQ